LKPVEHLGKSILSSKGKKRKGRGLQTEQEKKKKTTIADFRGRPQYGPLLQEWQERKKKGEEKPCSAILVRGKKNQGTMFSDAKEGGGYSLVRKERNGE